MYLSKNLRYLRLKNNYSQDHISDFLGYKSYTTVQKWETGVAEPSISVLSKLADLYDVDLDQLTKSDLSSDEHARPSMPSDARERLIQRVYEVDEEYIDALLLFMDELEQSKT
ncbi:MAG: helix-turn-helix domain-containing protein [Fastidiosipilaceae bacterium]|jgi:transcriptional regulator with XRE-family HTH domain